MDNNEQLLLCLVTGDEVGADTWLDLGADPNVKNDDGDPAIIMAANEGFSGFVETLIEYDADPNATDAKGNTVLHVAASMGNDDVADAVLDFEDIGVDLSLRNDKGLEAIHVAAIRQTKKVMDLLIENGADINSVDQNGNDAVMLMISRGDSVNEIKARFNAMKKLGEDKDVGEFDNDRFMELMTELSGIENDFKKTLHNMSTISQDEYESQLEEFMIEKVGEDKVKEFNELREIAFAKQEIENNKRKALNITMNASIADKTVSAFIENLEGYDFSKTYSNGETLAHIATLSGMKKTVEKLHEKGVDLSLEDNDGKTPLDYAREINRGKMAAFIESALASDNEKDNKSKMKV